jgi:LPS export ABC transporter protein LptC
MRRLSTIFLLCFVALLVGLGGTIAFKARGRQAPPAPPADSSTADYQIKEVRINETLEGNLRWTLDAERADVFDKTQRTLLRKVVIHLYSKDGDWTVTADEGVLDNDKRDVSLTGNVVISSSDGLRMSAPQLAWRNQDRHLFTDDPVEIRRAGTTIVGRGLDLHMRDGLAVIKQKVRVVITDRSNASLALFPRSGS